MVAYTASRNPKEPNFTTEHLFKKLGMKTMRSYLNGGVWLLNLEMIRNRYTAKQLVDYLIKDGETYRCFEQDVFSSLFQDDCLVLPFEWNWIVDTMGLIRGRCKYFDPNDPFINEYVSSEENAYIYHYVTNNKPWKTSVYKHSTEWWKVAEKSPFIKEIINNTANN